MIASSPIESRVSPYTHWGATVSRWIRSEHSAVLFVILAVTVVYALPQVRYFAEGHRDGLIQTPEEAGYVVRVREVLDGHWRAASQYLWEHKGNPPLLPYGAELFLASSAAVLGLDIDTLLIGIRIVAPAVLAWLLYELLHLLLQSVAWSVLGTALILLEPGTYNSKPILYLARTLGFVQWDDLTLFYTRLLNPLVFAVPFLLAVVAFYRALRTLRHRHVVLAGVALAVNFYMQVFYWAYLCVGMLILGAVYRQDRHLRRVILGVLGIGVVCGSYAVIEQLIGWTSGPSRDVLVRAGLLFRTREPFFALPKGLIATMVIVATLSRERDLRFYFFLSFLIGGYVLLNQNVITGLELQNYHFNYPNALIGGAALVAVAHRHLTAANAPLMAQVRVPGVIAVVASLAWLVVNGLVLQTRTYEHRMAAGSVLEGAYPSNLKEPFRKTLEWMRSNTPIDAVFLADPELSLLVPIYTSGNVFLNPLLQDHAASLMREDELFERWTIHLKLQGVTEAELFDMVRYRPDMSILGWGYGRNRALQERYDFHRLDAFARAIQHDMLARDYVAEYTRFPDTNVAARLRHYRLDYLVVSDRNRRFQERALSYLRGWPMALEGRIPEEQVSVFSVGRRN